MIFSPANEKKPAADIQQNQILKKDGKSGQRDEDRRQSHGGRARTQKIPPVSEPGLALVLEKEPVGDDE